MWSSSMTEGMSRCLQEEERRNKGWIESHGKASPSSFDLHRRAARRRKSSIVDEEGVHYYGWVMRWRGGCEGIKRVNISSGNLLLWFHLSHFILKFAIRRISGDVFLWFIGKHSRRDGSPTYLMDSSINYGVSLYYYLCRIYYTSDSDPSD